MEAHLCWLRDFVRYLAQPTLFYVATTDPRLYSSEHDQELDSLLVGPIPVGVNKFIFEAEPPNLARIPNNEILGVTVILLTCSYDGREFVRVGYYVNNEYTDEALIAEPPAKPVIEKVRRNILAEKPRVTRFAIKWCVISTAACRNVLNADKITGTRMRARRPNSRPTSLTPTWPTTTRRPTAPRRWAKNSRRRKRSRLRAKMRRWPVQMTPLVQTRKMMMLPTLALKTSRARAARTRKMTRWRVAATTTWRWTTTRRQLITSSNIWLRSTPMLWCTR